MAGMIPSPTGRGSPYGQITAQNNNPAFGQIMNYQLGRQTNQSAEEINRNRDYMALLQATINNAGGQAARGAVGQTDLERRVFDAGSGIGQTGVGTLPPNPYSRTIDTNALFNQQLQNTLLRGQANKLSVPYGEVTDPTGISRQQTPAELLNTLIYRAVGTPKPSGSGNGSAVTTIKNKNESYGPGYDAGGNYTVNKNTTENTRKVKGDGGDNRSANIPLLQLQQQLVAQQPSLEAGFKSGLMVLEDNGDGTATILINGVPVNTMPIPIPQ